MSIVTPGIGITLATNGSGSGVTLQANGPANIMIACAPADPATNTGGFSLAVISGLPQTLYPAVSVFSQTYNTKFIINTASTYGTPTGFTFLNNWFWSDYDVDLVSVSQTYNPDDTAQALVIPSNNGVRGSYAITPGTKCMFSVTHAIWSGTSGFDGVGVGSATMDYIGIDRWLGNDNQAIGIFDDGQAFTNGNSVASGYAIFETNGQIIDVAVDTVNNKMWYRVAGGVWQG
jgi:hypothetical protein